ncbi:MAG: MtrB/PioB family outer membrane beta-barrel protein, partial [Gammaproteobacteria bacterium]|nr:MtrB/PioB family outer membrane beta-barrel protein [Gammaproteobacteria bacterium]
MKKSFLLTVLIALTCPAPVVAADDQPDLSRWQCRFCPFEKGLDGSLGLGFGLAFDDAYRFGSGTGLDDDGAYLLGDMSLTWWGEDARFYELDASKLGTSARSLSLRGGVQGRYTFDFIYDELPYRYNNSGATPFLGIGGSNLTLPTGWQTAGSTRLMPDLSASLRPFAIGQDRKNFGLGLKFLRGDRWTHEISYSRSSRNGIGPHSGNFLTLSSILPAPIDYETDTFMAAVGYTATRWQARL